MAKSPNQKLKLLYLMKIFLEKTDDNHGLRAVDLMEELRQYGIEVERKSLYSDIEALQIFGLDINKIQKTGHFIIIWDSGSWSLLS